MKLTNSLKILTFFCFFDKKINRKDASEILEIMWDFNSKKDLSLYEKQLDLFCRRKLNKINLILEKSGNLEFVDMDFIVNKINKEKDSAILNAKKATIEELNDRISHKEERLDLVFGCNDEQNFGVIPAFDSFFLELSRILRDAKGGA